MAISSFAILVSPGIPRHDFSTFILPFPLFTCPSSVAAFGYCWKENANPGTRSLAKNKQELQRPFRVMEDRINNIRPYILVVDNMTDAADSLTLLLSLWGHDAEAKYCGATALSAVCVRRPAVVLLDISMAPMNGFEFTARLRQLSGGQQTAVVAISGYTSEAYQVRARALGIYHYLFKPANLDQLQLLLKQLIVQHNPQTYPINRTRNKRPLAEILRCRMHRPHFANRVKEALCCE